MKITVPETGHYVYKFVLDNEVLYIGKSDKQTFNRILQHGKAGDNIPKHGWGEINKADVYYTPLINSTMSDVVESELIRRYRPKYNKAKNSEWVGLPFVEPEFSPLRNNTINILNDVDSTNENDADSTYEKMVDYINSSLFKIPENFFGYLVPEVKISKYMKDFEKRFSKIEPKAFNTLLLDTKVKRYVCDGVIKDHCVYGDKIYKLYANSQRIEREKKGGRMCGLISDYYLERK